MIDTVLELILNPLVGVAAGVFAAALGIVWRVAGVKRVMKILLDSRTWIVAAVVIFLLGSQSLRLERDRLKDEVAVIEVETGAIVDGSETVMAREQRRQVRQEREREVDEIVDSAPEEEKVDVLMDEIANDQRRRRGDP